MTVKRFLCLIGVVGALVLPPGTGSAVEGAYAVTGTAQLSDGRVLHVDVQPTGRGPMGRLVLIEQAGRLAAVSEITVTCRALSLWTFNPIRPLVYNRIFLAGFGADSVQYYISVLDLGPHLLVGGDRVKITTTPGSGPCGVTSGVGPLIQAGDIVSSK